MWMFEGGRWKPVVIGVFENGQLTGMKVPSRPGEPVGVCLIRSNVLVRGDKDTCSALEAFPYSSAPPKYLNESQSGRRQACPYD